MSALFQIPTKWSSDIMGWVYVGVMAVCGVVGFATGEAAWLSLVALAILGAVEEKRMKRQGLAWPSNWWVLLFPVYLWKRLKALNLPMHVFWIWIGVAVALGVVGASLESSGLENAAMALITSRLHDSGVAGIDCVKVKLGEEFAPGNYRAKAVLSDGSVEDILIQKKDGMVIVRVAE